MLSAKSVLGGRVALTRAFLELDVSLNEHSKRWKGELGAEVQSE